MIKFVLLGFIPQHLIRLGNFLEFFLSVGLLVFVRVKLERQFPVSLFDVIFRSRSVDTQDFIIVLHHCDKTTLLALK